MSGRPIRIWKTPFQRAQHLDKTTFLGFDTIRRWRWRCYLCNLSTDASQRRQRTHHVQLHRHLLRPQPRSGHQEAPVNNATIHIAGLDVQVGPYLRQRCGWCGAVLSDYDLTCMAVMEGENPGPPMWAVGALVAIDGNASWVVDHEDGAQLPANACAQLDPAVTR